MKNDITVHGGYENETFWKQGLSVPVWTAGLKNKFTLRFSDFPGAAEGMKVGKGSIVLNLTSIPQTGCVLGTLEVPVTEDATEIDMEMSLPKGTRRGYYGLQILIKDEAGDVVDLYETYAIVDKAVDPAVLRYPYMDLRSIRMKLMDVSAQDNRLLKSLEFSNGDIAEAVRACVEQWNDRPVRQAQYQGHTFPHTEPLRDGVASKLMFASIVLLERNRGVEQAGGVTIDLERRVDAYRQFAMHYNNLWIDAIDKLKTQDDYNAFYGSYIYR